MKKKSCVIMLILLSVLLSFGTASVLAAPSDRQQEPRVVTVGFTDIPGMSEIDENGNRKGLVVDYLNEIGQYNNWEYEYIDVSSDELISDFLNGKYELMGGAFYSPDFESFIAYPKYGMGTGQAVLFCRNNDSSIKSYELSTLNGKTIGVYTQAADKTQRLKDFLKLNQLNCQLVYYTAQDMAKEGNLYRFLEQGDIDLLLGNEIEFEDSFRIAASFAAQPYYIVTHPGEEELLEGLNMGLEYILDSNPKFAESHYKTNFNNRGSFNLQLNDQELEYIADKETVTIAVAENIHPFYCAGNSPSYHSGILPELLDSVANFSGLTFEYITTSTYQNAIDLVKEGEADLLGYYLDSKTTAAQAGLALSTPYISLNNIIVRNKSAVYPSQGITAGVLRGRSVPQGMNLEDVQFFDTIQECLEAVDNGQVDVIYGLSSSIEQEMQLRRYNNIVPVTSIYDTIEITFAMERPINVNLMTILNKAVSNMSDSERTTLLDRNLVSMSYSSMSLTELIYSNPVAFITIFSLFVLLAAGAVVIIMQAKMKNTLMQSELVKSEAKSKAKTDFLSRMSHEIRTPMNAIVGLAELTCLEQNLTKPVEKNLRRIISSSRYLLSLINDILDMSRIESEKMDIEASNMSLAQLAEDLETIMRSQAEEKHLEFSIVLDITHEYIVGDPLRLCQVLINLLSNAFKFTPDKGEVKLLIKELACEGQTAQFYFSVKDTGVGIPSESLDRIFDSFEQVGTPTSKSAGTGLGLPISSSIVTAMGSKLQVNSEPGKGSQFHFHLTCILGEEKGEPQSQLATLDSLEGLRILLAEDNDLNAEIARELLMSKSAQVDWVCNGKEALHTFQASASETYQAILMDIRMPEMDGLEASKAIRSCSHPQAATIPIIAMTANSFKEDLDATKEAGMNGFVPKPVDLEYLLEVIKECLGQ